MPNENDFSNSGIYLEKVTEILKNSKDADGRIAFRAIKHSKEELLKKEDFFPTIMERNSFEMPGIEKQKKSKLELFGVSVCDSFENVHNLIQSVPALRNSVKCYAVGHVICNKGTIGEIDDKGHYQYYLFDPKSDEKNPYTDFTYYDGEVIKNG